MTCALVVLGALACTGLSVGLAWLIGFLFSSGHGPLYQEGYLDRRDRLRREAEQGRDAMTGIR